MSVRFIKSRVATTKGQLAASSLLERFTKQSMLALETTQHASEASHSRCTLIARDLWLPHPDRY
jgi:hypothetical protein